MNKDIKINPKQFKLLAIEVLLHNVKSDYDRRNKFDDYIVREVVTSFVKDGYEVILNPAKHIDKIEEVLKDFDAYPLASDYYEFLLSRRAHHLEREYSNKRWGLSSKIVPTEKSIKDAFDNCFAFKKEMRKRMGS